MALLCGLSSAPAMAQWTVTFLEPAGAGNSYATCAAGAQQGGYAAVGAQVHASLWSGTAASWVDLHPTGAAGVTVSTVLGMSPTTQVGKTYDGDNHAAMWSGTAASWVDLNPAGIVSSYAFATSGAMQVGSARTGNGDHASSWTGSASSWTDINPAVATSSYAFAISGTQIVGYINLGVPLASHAGLWTGAGASFVDLNPAGANGSLGYGVSGGQQVGFTYIGNQEHAALWTGSAGSWVDLNPSSGVTSRALAVAGGVQVGYTNNFGTRAALWSGTPASWVDLHSFLPPAFSTSQATGIWIDGTTTYVAGFGTRALDEPLLWKLTTACYANCDGSTSQPTLNVLDFSCFLNQFAAGSTYANCDHSTNPPVLNVLDFSCFLNAFASGCP